nr:MAG TPA: hypothetical protein [Caudoviricetes sp.]
MSSISNEGRHLSIYSSISLSTSLVSLVNS